MAHLVVKSSRHDREYKVRGGGRHHKIVTNDNVEAADAITITNYNFEAMDAVTKLLRITIPSRLADIIMKLLRFLN